MLLNGNVQKNEKDIPIPFGTCEFENIEGVLRCLRVMNGLNLLGSYLQVKPSDKTEKYLGEWSEIKKKEWQKTKAANAKEEDFERYLQKDDATALERIHILIDNFDVNKVREAREKEAEKKENPKEKERDRKKKMHAKELEKNFKKELAKWLEYEENMEKSRRKDKERERERDGEKDRSKQKLLERELDYDSEEERRRKNNPKYLEQRKKARQRELEEDENSRETKHHSNKTKSSKGASYTSVPTEQPSFQASVTPSILTSSPEFALFLDLRKRAFTIKVFCVVDFIFALYGVFFRAWWLSIGILFSALGFYAVSKYSRRLIQIYFLCLLADIIIQIVSTSIHEAGLLIALAVLITLLQLYIMYFLWQFYKRIPRDVERIANEIAMEVITNNVTETRV